MTPTEAVARLLAKEAWGYDCWAEEMPEGMRDGYLRRAEMLVRAADAARCRPMSEAPIDVEVRAYGAGLPPKGRSFVRTGEWIEGWSRTGTERRLISALPTDWRWLHIREVTP